MYETLEGKLGITVYDGPSMLDGAPIIGVITLNSRNPKTGDMPQLWIIRKDVAPAAAIRAGENASICGHCPAIPYCYVNLMGPEGIYVRFHKGQYPAVSDVELECHLITRFLRLGAYGDPAALPYDLVVKLTGMAAGWTGYTHQWETADPRFAGLVMASVESDVLRAQAHAKGYRTFSVRPEGTAPSNLEIFCPATPEGGNKTNCVDCRLCDGKTGPTDRRKDITVYVHGSAKRKYLSLREVI